jgi:hypothetical protein
MATRGLDAQLRWMGSAVSEAQALGWPRVGVIGRNGFELDSNAIPLEVQQATCEYARQLLESDRFKDSTLEAQGIRAFSAGPVSFQFDRVVAKPMPDAVFYMVQHLGVIVARGSGTVPLVRV